MAAAFNAYLAEQYAGYRDRLDPRGMHPHLHARGGAGRARACRGRARPQGGHDGRAPSPALFPKVAQGRSGWTASATALSTTTTHFGGAASSSGCPLPSTRQARAGGLACRQNNFVYNHIGNFAAAGELTCRSLLFGGVPLRFPELRFAFQEGGTAWACNLYSDIVGHWEKRNDRAVGATTRPSSTGDLTSLFEHASLRAGRGNASADSTRASACCRSR